MTALFSLTLTILLAALVSGQVRLDRPLYVGGTDDQLQYDDGSANWLTWSGLYRGTWFNTDDFYGYPCSFEADNTEFWFYHHLTYSWDTTSFYAELYNGDVSGPVTQLDQTSVTAIHFSAAYANYSTPIVCDDQFWVLVNTEMSVGGWPALLGDNSPQAEDHSFYSDDFMVWIPWVPSTTGLGRTTWGEVKTLFDTCRYRSTPGCCDYFIRTSSSYPAVPGWLGRPDNR